MSHFLSNVIAAVLASQCVAILIIAVFAARHRDVVWLCLTVSACFAVLAFCFFAGGR